MWALTWTKQYRYNWITNVCARVCTRIQGSASGSLRHKRKRKTRRRRGGEKVGKKKRHRWLRPDREFRTMLQFSECRWWCTEYPLSSSDGMGRLKMPYTKHKRWWVWWDEKILFKKGEPQIAGSIEFYCKPCIHSSKYILPNYPKTDKWHIYLRQSCNNNHCVTLNDPIYWTPSECFSNSQMRDSMITHLCLNEPQTLGLKSERWKLVTRNQCHTLNKSE